MLAYRHGFHAGMHADVLKHLVLVQVLRHVGGKPKPYTYLDTHAGAGGYDLSGATAQKTAEYREGIGRLWAGHRDAPLAVAEYLAVVRRFNGPGDRLVRYPGSPAIAAMLRSAADRLRLYEMHPTDYRLLDEAMGAEPNVQVARSDGFAALKAELPPPSRRGVVLIDPSYEIKTDYAKVADAVRTALTRFAEAVLLVWLPDLPIREARDLPDRLQRIAQEIAPRGWLQARLRVQQPDAQGFGLVGSTMFVVNPPYILHGALGPALPWLARVLGQYEGASSELRQQAA